MTSGDPHTRYTRAARGGLTNESSKRALEKKVPLATHKAKGSPLINVEIKAREDTLPNIIVDPLGKIGAGTTFLLSS